MDRERKRQHSVLTEVEMWQIKRKRSNSSINTQTFSHFRSSLLGKSCFFICKVSITRGDTITPTDYILNYISVSTADDRESIR